MTKLLGTLLTVVSANAFALGLGEIELDSALNEELRATIDLTDTGELAAAEILVSLASTEDFERVGVERFFFLTDLEFSITLGDDGQSVVSVVSSRPITEPYLNFIVEVLWPNGKLLKEYTLLLDPPTFSQAAAPVVSAPVESSRNPAVSGRVQRQQPARSTGTQVQMAPGGSRAPQPSPLDQDVVGDQFRMTDRNDTLWSIAARTRPSGQVSVQQNMLAIQRLNPDAFINGNINLMKAGYSLRLPDEATADSMTQAQAVAAVAAQNDAWRSGSAIAAAPQPSQSEPASVADRTSDLRSPVDATAQQAPSAATQTSEGELRIVAGAGDSATGVADAPGEDVSTVLEENDRLARELEELAYQRELDQEIVENQLTVKERQLEVKDKQIAELQQQLADMQAQPASAPPAPAQTQNQSTPEANWWENPLVMYGGVGVLVLALVGGMLAARRRREDTEDFFEATEPVLDEPDAYETDQTIEDEYDDEDDFVATTEPDDAEDDERPGSETSDVIGEADIYIAYGRYPQAIGLLLGVLEDDAGRNDVRLKLLELYSETNDREAFDEHLAQLVEHCEDEDALLSAREMESRFGEKSISLEDVLAEDSDEAESNITESFDAEDETPSVADSTSSKIEFEAPAAIAEDDLFADAGSDDDVGFELELDELADEPDETATKTSSGADLGGDLGIDFDPDRDVAEADTSQEPAAELSVEATAVEHDAADQIAKADVDDEDHINLDDMGLGTELDTPAGKADAFSGTELEAELEGDVALAEEDEFDFQEEGDSANTKLDLARAYIDMGDADGARDILKEVVDEGNSEQQQQAQSMLESL
jgi:pilus assembly protein FimV